MNTEDRYLDLLKRSLLNEIYLDDELRILYLRDCLQQKDSFSYDVLHDIRDSRKHAFDRLKESRQLGRFVDRDIHNSGFSHTMVGRERLDSLHECMDMIRTNNIQGDLVECGVWRGGCVIFIAAYLSIYGIRNRRVFAVDSFMGLPKPSVEPDREIDLSQELFPELSVSMETVKENFRVYGLDPEDVIFLSGWFKDSLPDLNSRTIALLRLDGDLYESTRDCLVNLYDKVVEGGIVIIDDWGVLPPCQQAVIDFFNERNIPLPTMTKIDWSGVFWIK